MDAIEKGLYGWFWECPSGGEKCKYRHALPPGFVFVPLSQRQDADEAENDQEKTFEELIEEQVAFCFIFILGHLNCHISLLWEGIRLNFSFFPFFYLY